MIGSDWVKCPTCGQRVAPSQVRKCPKGAK